MNTTELNKCLERFYVLARKQDGTHLFLPKFLIFFEINYIFLKMCYSPARLILIQLSPSVSVPSDRYSPPLLGIIVNYSRPLWGIVVNYYSAYQCTVVKETLISAFCT